MGGGGRDLGIGSRSNKRLLGQHRVVITVDQIVSDPGMVRLLLQDRFENFAAFPLVSQRFVRFRRRNVQHQRVADGGFAVVWVCGLHCPHVFLEGLRVGRAALAVLAVNFSQSVDVSLFPRRSPRIRGCNVLCPQNCGPPGSQVTVLPQTMIVRHGDTPVGHGTLGILTADFYKCFPGLFVLKRVQERNCTIKTRLYTP